MSSARWPESNVETRVGVIVVEHARRILREIGDGEEAVVAALAGRTRSSLVTAAPAWMQAVVAPADRR